MGVCFGDAGLGRELWNMCQPGLISSTINSEEIAPNSGHIGRYACDGRRRNGSIGE